MEWVDCLVNGSWLDRMQTCRRQMQLFERCYSVNSVRYSSLPTSRLF
jgi:hypothetical protein